MIVQFTEIQEAVKQITEDVIRWRRDFHQYPEVSFKEERTARVVADTLRTLGLPVREKVNGYGVVADLTGGKPGPSIALRADMDALPIQEETGLAFASKHEGVMHACGHDGHTAILLGTASVLTRWKDQLQGRVRFIFQPAEELVPGGARGMIDEGVLDGIDAVFGCHLWSEFPLGDFRTAEGAMMAASDKFTVDIEGKGGHGGLPHHTVDALVTASHLVMAAQHIVSRQLDPLESGVISFGQIHAGSSFNAIAERAALMGTIRSFSPEIRRQLSEGLRRTAESVAQMYGTKILYRYEQGYPPLINHSVEAGIALQAAGKVFGEEQSGWMKPNMAGEDFAYYLQQVPGAFCFIGAGSPERETFPHHHPKFDIDERALPLAVEWFCRLVFHYLGNRD